MQTACPLVREWRGLGSPGLGVHLKPPAQWAVYTPQDAPFSRAQARQQPQPGSLSTCLQSEEMAGHSFSFSWVQGAQRIGSGPTTGDDIATAKKAKTTNAATNVTFGYNPDISSLQVQIEVFNFFVSTFNKH